MVRFTCLALLSVNLELELSLREPRARYTVAGTYAWYLCLGGGTPDKKSQYKAEEIVEKGRIRWTKVLTTNPAEEGSRAETARGQDGPT